MAELKKEIRTLGQRISGLMAGNQYVFVLKRPNARVDVLNAERAIEIAEEQLGAVRKLFAEFERARADALRGEVASARAIFAKAKELLKHLGNKVSKSLLGSAPSCS